MIRSGAAFSGIFFIVAAVLLAGCERRPLEEFYTPTCKVVFRVDWSKFPEVPTGMTMYFFREGDEAPRVVTTSEVRETSVNLEAGNYRMFFINQSPGEFGSVSFVNMNLFEDSGARLEEIPSTWFGRTSDPVGHDPENIGEADLGYFSITEEDVERYQGAYKEWNGDRSSSAAAQKVELTTRSIQLEAGNVVSEFWVTIYAERADVLYSVRAAITGMAMDYGLTQGRTLHSTATQLMENWTLTMDDEINRVGHLDGIIPTFGLPDGVTQTAGRDSSLNVAALLLDKSVYDYKFSVGDKIEVLPGRPGYKYLLRLVFGSVSSPAVEFPDIPLEGRISSGFDAIVEDWEDGGTVDIGL